MTGVQTCALPISIAAALFTSILGGTIAFLTLKYQENLQIEKDKLDTVNKWTLIAEEALASLISLKHNYLGKLDDNPINRALKVPSIIHTTKEIHEDVVNLAFIVPKLNDLASQNIKWRKITLIRAMLKNYNFLIGVWNKRNEVDRPIKVALKERHPELSDIGVSKQEVIDCIGEIKLNELIDLTENVVNYTDALIIELHDFVVNFPIVVKPFIKTKKLKRYGEVLTYSDVQTPALIKSLPKESEVNYNSLAEIFGEDAVKLKLDYSTGYE